MSKYLIIWETDTSKLPMDNQERGGMYLQMMDAVKQSFETGPTVDWGQFVGGGKGYAISEGTSSEVFVHLQQYAPYVTFKVQEVLTADETIDAIKALMG